MVGLALFPEGLWLIVASQSVESALEFFNPSLNVDKRLFRWRNGLIHDEIVTPDYEHC